MNPNGRRGAKPDQTKDTILKAAQDLFLAHGYEGTSMRDIANASGATQSLIHHHFGNKQSLWRHIKSTYFDDYVMNMTNLTKHDGQGRFAERIKKLIEERFRYFAEKPERARMLLWQTLDPTSASLKGRGNKLFSDLIDAVKQAQNEGEMRSDIDPHLFIYSIFSLTSAWFLGDMERVLTDINAETYLENIVKIALEGVLVR